MGLPIENTSFLNLNYDETNATTYTSFSTVITTSINKLADLSTTEEQQPLSAAALLNINYYSSLTAEAKREFDFHHELPGQPSNETVVAILSLSAIVFFCSSLVLLATRYTSGGQSGTLVLLRSLLMSDMLMAAYGVTKMIMLFFLNCLRVNFFLPDSLFFTASLASSFSLLSLHLDCFLTLTKPLQYAQVEKHTVITVMLLVWNVAFVVGFMPLVGWHHVPYTFRFFSFYPWHFLLFNGLVIFICVVVCIFCMASLKRVYIIPEADTHCVGGLTCFEARTLEICKYRRFHRTIVIETAMWIGSYLPFFIYVSLTCRQCFLSDYSFRDVTIIYFLPVFLAKSLISAVLQAFRTFHVHTVMTKFLTEFAHHNNQNHHHHHQQQRHRHDHQEDTTSTTNNPNTNNNNSLATISYTNPLSDYELNYNNQNHCRRHHPDCHHHYHHQHHHHQNNHHHHNRHNHNNHTSQLEATDITNVNSMQERRMANDSINCNTNDNIGDPNWAFGPQRSSSGPDLIDQFNLIDNDVDISGNNGVDDKDTTSVLASVNASDTIMGISNPAFLPSLYLDTSQEQSTKL